MDQVKEEEEHALKLINYVNQRGGRVCFELIESPASQEWSSPICVFKDALKLEDKVTEVCKFFSVRLASRVLRADQEDSSENNKIALYS